MATGTNCNESTNISLQMVYDFTCTLCAKRDISTEAAKFCLECQEYLCSECTESHNIFPLMAEHVLQKAELTSRDKIHKSFSQPYLPTERCPKHPAEIIKMYCAIHDQVACAVCTTISHMACNDVHYIPNIVQTLYTKQMNTDSITALFKASEKMKTLKEMCNNALDDLNMAKQTTLQAIQKFRQELNHVLDKLELSTKQQLDDQYQILQIQWQVLSEKGATVTNILQKQLDQLLKTENNTSQQFVLAKMSKENISLADNMCSLLLPSSVQITFSQSQAIKNCFEQLSSLGNVSNRIVLGKLDLYIVKEEHKHKVWTKRDIDTMPCNVWGFCVLDSGHLLLADSCGKNLKLFDTNKNAVTSYCIMPHSPHAVCIVSDEEAAVSLDNRIVQFVSIKKCLLPTRILKMDHECWGLAIAGDKMYITSANNLYVHELNGKLLRTINKDQSGQKIFSDALHLTVSKNGNIYVADMNFGLITLDTYGQVVWKYSGSDLNGAHGVSIDGCGNVFVCGNGSHNVLQIRHDGQRLGEIVNKIQGVSYPVCVLFDKKNCRLIITCSSNDDILVFSLE